MEITFLGTSCMVPTKERNHQSIYLKHKGQGFLFDCGEGTQRQLKLAGIKPGKITKIFISHWHGDHVLGLPGLLQTLNASDYENTLEIYGPKGTKRNFDYLFKAFSFNISFEHKITELNNAEIDFKEFTITVKQLVHSVPCLGFSFVEKDRRKIRLNYIKKYKIPEGPLLGKLQENQKIVFEGKTHSPAEATYLVKGKKIAFVLDTLVCNEAMDLARDADLLISEAVYSNKHKEKARENYHMTAEQAAQLASQANVKKLVLTHFSQRYKDLVELENEAKTVFKEVIFAHDLMKQKI